MRQLESMVILGCSQRKVAEQNSIPAVARYNGPTFQVLRKHISANPARSPSIYILSGSFGLIPGAHPLPSYDHRLTSSDIPELRLKVEDQLRQALTEHRPERLFVSVGRLYWTLLEEPLLSASLLGSLTIAGGGIGGRASQLARWLRRSEEAEEPATINVTGEAVLLGTVVRMTADEVLLKAEAALPTADPKVTNRFETWFVKLGEKRVSPKWLASVLFNKPVDRFRSSDARRVLLRLGVAITYAD